MRTGQRIILFHVLYNSQVIPHLEYCVHAWRPYLQKYTNNIEGVQPRMSKMMREVEDEEYEQRMKKTKLMYLDMIRLRSDLIEVYKIMHNSRPQATRLLPTAQRWSERTSVYNRKAIQSPQQPMMTWSFTPQGFPVGRRGIGCLVPKKLPILGIRRLAGLVRLGEGRVHQEASRLVGRSSLLAQSQHRTAH